MSLLSSLLVGATGLRAAQSAVQTTAHNVANATTAGYHARRVDQSTANPIRTGKLWHGQGVDVDQIERTADRFITKRQTDASGDAAAASTYYRAMQEVESYFDESVSTGLRESLDAFFDALTGATADPSDRGLRLAVTTTAGRLAYTVNRTAEGMQERMDAFGMNIEDSLTGINDKLREIADLNNALTAAGGPLAAGDLADSRDLLIREVAEEIGVTAHFDATGGATVLLGGHALVSGGEARSLSVATDADGAPVLQVSADSGVLDVTSEVGGAVEGALQAYDRASAYLEQLDTFARDFTTAVNAQHAAGVDLTGGTGEALFTVDASGSEAITMAPSVRILANPDLLAFATTIPPRPGDDGNLQALLALEDAAIIDSSSATAGSWLTDVTRSVAQDVDAAATIADSQQALLADLDELSQNLHGVDLDEEAANLMLFQAAYGAAAKVVQASDQMLSTLLELG